MKNAKVNFTTSNSYKRQLVILSFSLLSITLNGQKIHTKEIKQTYNNGVGIFSIITDDVKIKFDEDLEYNWYNEFSGSQRSKGTAGGNLLHGKSSTFNEQGRLVFQCFYKYGLQDSTSITWDASGEISSKYIFKNGIEKSMWSKSGKYIFETFSSFDAPDYIRYSYTLDNKILSEEKCISTNPYIHEIKLYNEINYKLQSHYYSVRSHPSSYHFYGKILEFNNDGTLRLSGNYDKKYKMGNKIGIWLVYNDSSKQVDSIKYKLSEKILNSANDKEIGSLIYSSELKDWIKCEHWYHIDYEGFVIEELEMGSDTLAINSTKNQKTEIITETPSSTIKLVKTESGLLEVPVVLNGVLKINFIFDSGASEVSLSPDVALTLIRTGTVTDTDFLPDQTYLFADGSSAKSKRFLIRKLIIGNQTLINIEASISKSIDAPMLIGQNVMNKLGTITIDYDKLLLIIKSK